MHIRQAISSDAPSINKLLTQLGYPPPDDNFVKTAIQNYSGQGYHLLVGEVEGNVIAFSSLHWFDFFHSTGKIGRITAFCVSENLRSQGIGQELLKASEQFLVANGCTKVEVTSNLKRVRTHEFYLKSGYTIDSNRFIKLLALSPLPQQPS